MNRCIFIFLFFFTFAFLSYSQCAPNPQPLSATEFQRQRDENVHQLIEKEKLTCDNLDSFCYRNLPTDEIDALSKLACKLILQTYVCEDKMISD